MYNSKPIIGIKKYENENNKYYGAKSTDVHEMPTPKIKNNVNK